MAFFTSAKKARRISAFFRRGGVGHSHRLPGVRTPSPPQNRPKHDFFHTHGFSRVGRQLAEGFAASRTSSGELSSRSSTNDMISRIRLKPCQSCPFFVSSFIIVNHQSCKELIPR